jgi:signal transduction histidine kinase
LSNLVGNATCFAVPGSAVLVRIDQASSGLVTISVQNTGPALHASETPRLFDRFYRADSARTCSSNGDEPHFGLGLSIVSAIARMHGGAPFAHSAQGLTSVGFTLAPAAAAP